MSDEKSREAPEAGKAEGGGGIAQANPLLLWPWLVFSVLCVLESSIARIDPVFERGRIAGYCLALCFTFAIFLFLTKRFPVHRFFRAAVMTFFGLSVFYLLMMGLAPDFADSLMAGFAMPLAFLVYPGFAGLFVIFIMIFPLMLGDFSRKNMQEGFQALALMLVSLLMLLILFVTSGWGFMRAPRQSLLTACRGNLREMASALDAYALDNQGKYPSSMAPLVPEYLQSLPVCAASGEKSYHYTVNAQCTNFTVWCAGKYHRTVTGFLNFPQYNALNGMSERPSEFQ